MTAVNILKPQIETQDTQTLIECYQAMQGCNLEPHERLADALITDELERRNVLVWNDETEEYTFCA